MKITIAMSIVCALIFGACKKEETANQNQFDGTIKGKWEVKRCPKEWSNGQASYVVFSSNGSFMAMYPSNGISPTYKTWEGDMSFLVSVGGRTYTVSQKSSDNITLLYKNSLQQDDSTYLHKLSNDQCPNITSIEKDPMGSNSLLFKGNPEFVPESDIITNMEIRNYWQDKGICFFGKALTDPTNYITFSRQGCPILSFKMESGIWRKQ